MMNITRQWSIISTTVILLCILSYLFADLQTALWFHALENTLLHQVFEKITLFGDSLGYLIGGALLFVVFRKWNLSWASSSLFLFSTGAVSGSLGYLIGVLFVVFRKWNLSWASSGLFLFSTVAVSGSLGYLIGVLFVVFRKWNLSWASSGLFLFSTVAVSGLSADLLKYIAGRARPKLYFSEHLYGFDFFHWQYEWTSFPSGHSATALSVAMLFAILYPRWRFAALFGGILIAFSRIVLAQHYISDVIAGSYLGIVSTALLYNLYFKSKFDAFENEKI
jgi:membrane-associated phospholipid phosphatase